MAWLTWQRGRQGTGYDKMLLATARWPLPFDCYLLRYPQGSRYVFSLGWVLPAQKVSV
jgi:hypothetical protein